MGRGLGPRQLEVLRRLAAADGYAEVFDLADDPDDDTEMNRVRQLVRGLKARGLVATYREGSATRTNVTSYTARGVMGSQAETNEVERATAVTHVHITEAGRQELASRTS